MFVRSDHPVVEFELVDPLGECLKLLWGDSGCAEYWCSSERGSECGLWVCESCLWGCESCLWGC